MYHYDEQTFFLQAYLCDYVSETISFNKYSKTNWLRNSQLQNDRFAPTDLAFIKALENG